jgi:hypothetical protein
VFSQKSLGLAVFGFQVHVNFRLVGVVSKCRMYLRQGQLNPQVSTISSGTRAVLCHRAIRRTETPVPATHRLLPFVFVLKPSHPK